VKHCTALSKLFKINKVITLLVYARGLFDSNSIDLSKKIKASSSLD